MSKWKRRAFISAGVLAGGAVIFGVAIRPGNRSSKVKDIIADKEDSVFDVWLKISPDNTTTVIIPHAEMGQGVHTTLAMMLAEELDADWNTIKFEEAPAHKQYANYALIQGFATGGKNVPTWLMETVEGTFLTISKKMGFQITGGSASVRFTGVKAMAVAGAATKEMLKKAASSEWKVPTSEIETIESKLIHKASNRIALYSEFAAQASELSLPVNPSRKTIDEYKIMGTSPPRIDIPAKVDGTAIFAIDTQLPNMKYAAVKASPVFGNKLKAVDQSKIKSLKGVHKIVELDNAVAVIADGYWQAKTALEALEIEFEKSENNKVSQDTIYSQYSKDLDAISNGKNRKKDYKSGDVENAFKKAKIVIEAEYKVPFLAHATMEPMNCTAWVREGICDLWTGSQNPLGFKYAVAKALNLEKENVQVHNQLLGGGFGRRSENDVPVMAAQIAKEVDYPIKMIWSREEDIRQDVYREATISRFRAGIDENNQAIAYSNQYLIKHHPKEASQIPYDIANKEVYFADSKTHIPWGNWRSVDHTVHGFAIESFIDEMAYASGKDGFQFRRGLLAHDPRSLKVLDLAAEKSEWGKSLPPNWGRGISLQTSFGTIVAEVVEVEVIDNDIKVHRVICAADPGFAVHPNGFIAQIESGVIYGLSAALHGEISIENGAVTQSNFHDYPILRMEEAPKIETYIINSGEALGGGGEPGTPGIASALGNAIFDATGVRVRTLPFSKAELKKKEVIG
jgi:isoquinoline 1-oxidoreductase beta subunit